MNLPEIKPGDVLLMDGKGLVSGLIRFLIRMVFGIKDPFSHVQIAYDKDIFLSADAPGVRLVGKPKLTKLRKWVLARNKNLAASKNPWIIQKIEEYYRGKGYDFFIYIIWLLRVGWFYLPIFLLIFSSLKLLIVAMAVSVFLSFPIRNWLKSLEVKRYTCSELTATILADLGEGIGIDEPHNAAPDHVYQVIKACPCVWEIIATSKDEE